MVCVRMNQAAAAAGMHTMLRVLQTEDEQELGSIMVVTGRSRQRGLQARCACVAGLLRVLVMRVDSLKMHALDLNQAEQDRETGLGLQAEALGHGIGGACRHAAGHACGT